MAMIRFILNAIAVAVILIFATAVSAQPIVKISKTAWGEIRPEEQQKIQSKYVVSIVDAATYGLIIDHQGIDQSTAGTTGGSDLGGAVANAAYIDGALKNGNYSAKNQLAAGLLGAILGSSLDSKPKALYRHRYTVKLGSGEIKFYDEANKNPFRTPAGVCVSVPSISVIDQKICTQTGDALRSSYLEASIRETTPLSETKKQPQLKSEGLIEHTSSVVNCKIGMLAPVKTSLEKCVMIHGDVLK
jgi:hypothetical protein